MLKIWLVAAGQIGMLTRS